MVRSREELIEWAGGLKVLDQVRAVPPGQASATAPEEAPAGLLPMTDRLAFEAEGWRFLPAGEAEPGAQVPVLRPDGTLAIATGLMRIRLDADLGPEEAAGKLASFGFEVVRPIRYVPNGWVVRTRASDLPDDLRRANGDAAVIYAEPELVEVIGTR